MLGEKFRGIDPACTLTCFSLDSEAYKMEVDAKAYRGASANKAEHLYFLN